VKSVPSLFTLSACALALSLLPSFAKADEPSPAAKVKARVEEGLIKPLAQRDTKKTSRFSRARLPPQERRVRVTQTDPSRDKSDRPFMAFAIDVRYGTEWKENDVVGCAYLGSRDLFVKVGGSYRPAKVVLGQYADDAPAGTCVAV
jgi:hypothetical protein